MQPRFDYYSASLRNVHPALIFPGRRGRPCSTRYRADTRRFAYGCALRSDDDARIGRIYWNEIRDHSAAYVVASGPRSPILANILRIEFPMHSVPRMDSCIDLDTSTSFKVVEMAFRNAARRARLQSKVYVSPIDGSRTLYVGSTKSRLLLRAYARPICEFDSSLRSPSTMRIELQVRPASKVKAQFAQVSPEKLWSLSTASISVASDLCGISIFPEIVGLHLAPRFRTISSRSGKR